VVSLKGLETTKIPLSFLSASGGQESRSYIEWIPCLTRNPLQMVSEKLLKTQTETSAGILRHRGAWG
jgi:hypothetical protein